MPIAMPAAIVRIQRMRHPTIKRPPAKAETLLRGLRAAFKPR
jgi:hypothetical protein